eukprot:356921-Chlamydomonas_euryale.AAC.1
MHIPYVCIYRTSAHPESHTGAVTHTQAIIPPTRAPPTCPGNQPRMSCATCAPSAASASGCSAQRPLTAGTRRRRACPDRHMGRVGGEGWSRTAHRGKVLQAPRRFSSAEVAGAVRVRASQASQARFDLATSGMEQNGAPRKMGRLAVLHASTSDSRNPASPGLPRAACGQG